MYSISELQELLSARIEAQQYPVKPQGLYDPIRYILSLGGKRMRPVLLLMATDMFGGKVTSALDAALAIEVFHNFTLVHDDLMDNAPLRRSQVTVHEKWNSNTAILSGDVMLVEAYQLLLKTDLAILKNVLTIFSNTARGVCEGQQLDMSFEQRNDVQLDEYINMIRLKTAVLLGGSLKIGALIAGADETQANRIYNFGEKIGIAFQLQDDILDVYGDPEKFGKQTGGDILANKKTWLLISALQQDQSNDLLHWLKLENPDPKKKVQAVTEIYNRLNIRAQAEREMEIYADEALSSLNSLSVSEGQKNLLQEFANRLLVREV